MSEKETTFLHLAQPGIVACRLMPFTRGDFYEF
jgi:hypothetical protein